MSKSGKVAHESRRTSIAVVYDGASSSEAPGSGTSTSWSSAPATRRDTQRFPLPSGQSR